ncbi:aminotransferase class IV [Wukongibacter baidiensis]|uniref:aminotransferase class IV n=1 Tax=Wukongibacter baidiensis TaxID=1723361 RepID=UPI003D7FB5B4
MYISLNGKILKSQDAQVSPLSEAFLYGFGLFETIKVVNGKQYFFEEHMKRIKKGCSTLDFEIIYNEDTLYEYCCELIEKNQLSNGAIRVSYSKNKSSYILLISSRENDYNEEHYKKGFRLCFADIKRNPHSPIVYLKSNNYLENLLARQDAKKKGFDEAVFLNIYEKTCEGTVSNIFFVKNNKIFTPDVECGILLGILREKVISIINRLNLELNIGSYEKEQLYDADEVFITNSLMDIMPVCSLEDIEYDMKNNNITKTLIKEIKELYNG